MLSEFQERNSKKVKPIQVDYRHNVVRFKLEREIFSADKKIFLYKISHKESTRFYEKIFNIVSQYPFRRSFSHFKLKKADMGCILQKPG